MYYQLIEHDLKYIYAYMRKGDIDNNLERIENMTLGQMIKILQDLDNSDGHPLISAGDYNFLSQIKDNRNLWAHSNFTEFIYKQNFLYSKEYQSNARNCKKTMIGFPGLAIFSRISEWNTAQIIGGKSINHLTNNTHSLTWVSI